jgi:hypothetical protein
MLFAPPLLEIMTARWIAMSVATLLFSAAVYAAGIVVSDINGTFMLVPQNDGTFRSVPINSNTLNNETAAQSTETNPSATGGEQAGQAATTEQPGTEATVTPGLSIPYVPQQQAAQCPPVVCNCQCPQPTPTTPGMPPA